jgi:enoyl-CoA hydratase/carnithine racemase
MKSVHTSQLSIDRSMPGTCTITFSNPPINMINNGTISELHAMMPLIEEDESLKVVVFESADAEFFIAHYDTGSAAQASTNVGNTPLEQWREFVLRLSRAPVVSIAKVRGYTRGGGNEFVLACDLRFASREKAVFGQPEVGVGVVPGGGALEWLPRLVGRSRALEIVLSADDFGADVAQMYGMINRAVDDAQLDAYVNAFATRIASFDKQAIKAAKVLLNRSGIPDAEELAVSSRTFVEALTWPEAQARRTRLRQLGYANRTDFERTFGSALAGI